MPSELLCNLRGRGHATEAQELRLLFVDSGPSSPGNPRGGEGHTGPALQSSSSAADLCSARPTASQELATGPKRGKTGAKCGLRWTSQNRGEIQPGLSTQSQEPWDDLKAKRRA